jgi:predicted oxidoreductase
VLLEKNERLGGSTAWSIGSISSTGTPHQRRRGIADSPAEHWADMPGFAGALAARDKCPSRRTASRACTTRCPTRARTSITWNDGLGVQGSCFL